MKESEWMDEWMNECFSGEFFYSQNIIMSMLQPWTFTLKDIKKSIDPKSKFYATSCIDLFIRRSCIMLWNVLYRVVHCVKALNFYWKIPSSLYCKCQSCRCSFCIDFFMYHKVLLFIRTQHFDTNDFVLFWLHVFHRACSSTITNSALLFLA